MTPTEYRAAKAKLTRAINTGDPMKILAAARAGFDLFNKHGNYYPDDWHRWQIAEQDAVLALQREAYYR